MINKDNFSVILSSYIMSNFILESRLLQAFIYHYKLYTYVLIPIKQAQKGDHFIISFSKVEFESKYLLTANK